MEKGEKIIGTNFKHLYWSCAQQLTHHSVTGCNMQPGDLLGSGTISGDKKEEFGSLLELTWGGKETISLTNGETRTFIQDGDTVVMTGYALKAGKRIGFGECSGKVLPVLPETDYY
jgi:fumarylacetoacetase